MELESYCYHFSKKQTTWHEARRICQQKAADLVVPKNSVENEAISNSTNWPDNRTENFRGVEVESLC